MTVGWPQPQYYIKDLLVVGAANVLTGDIWDASGVDVEKGLPHVYAPGENIVGVDGDKRNWAFEDRGSEYRITEGTSVGEFRHF